MISLIVLVTEQMEPVPAKIRVNRDFGTDVVLTDAGTRIRGKVLAIQGNAEDLKIWFKPHPEICVTNRPVTGNWTLHDNSTMLEWLCLYL